MHGRASHFTQRLLRWYDLTRRDLPWRVQAGSTRRLDPWHVLVSEAMLQQTQVATVIPYFLRFVERFPTISSLADASEQEVLRFWQGLGYYSRARNLHHAARQIMKDHGGIMPRTIEQLLALPGIGRYTAGAVASIAFDFRAPILDGNVARVLSRLDAVRTDPREKRTRELLWRRAEQVLPDRRCGDFNSALMELGATVCTPRAPKCLVCPVQDSCEAKRAGVAELIPPPLKRRPSPLLRRDVVCLRRAGGKFLVEQRPGKGRWANMWQFLTLDAGPVATLASRAAIAGNLARSDISKFRRIGSLRHELTHRRYEFRVYHASVSAPDRTAASAGDHHRAWMSLRELDGYPMPGPHVKIMHTLLKATEAPDQPPPATSRICASAPVHR
jgi:A/G-specific adenine glycosylase